MSILLTVFWSCLEICYFHFFCSAFLRPKVFGKRYALHFFVAWLAACLYLNVGLPPIVENCLSIVMLILLCSVTYQGQFLRNLLFVIPIFVIGGIFDTLTLYAVSSLLGISIQDFVWRKATYSITVTLSKLLFLLAGWILCRFRKAGKPEPVQTKWLLLSLLFPAITLVMMMSIFYGYRDRGDVSTGIVGLCSVLVLANVASLYLTHHLEKSAAEAKNQALLTRQMEIQTESIGALERSYRAQRQAIHEHRAQLQTIYDLMVAGKYSSAEEYIQRLQVVQTTRIFAVNSHHPIIDAVLNHKYQKATEQGIDFQAQVNDLSGISLEADALVVVLSNLLENAIEACLRFDGDRQIHCRILAEDSLFISIRNTSLPVQIIDNSIATTKQNKQNHGYGLQQIGYILQQQKAEYSISYEDGWFQFVAEIPLK
jgi:hypothetical protein